MSDGVTRPTSSRDEAGPLADEAGPDVAWHLAETARLLLISGTTPAAVGRIASLAVGTLDSCEHAALCGNPPGSNVSSTSALMIQVDELQSQLGEGPCPDTFAGIDSVYIPDLLDDQRYPQFSPAAAGLGIRSALAYRLSAGGQTVGALQFYASLPVAFNPTERAQGLIFATYAGLALSLASSHDAEQARIANLQTALASREVIGQAQGILMERERITAEQAFQLLRRSSQDTNSKLRVVAQELVETGTIPLVPPPP